MHLRLHKLTPLTFGILASSAMALFYITVMRVTAGNFRAVSDSFVSLWYFITPLIIGFGIEMGLFHDVRKKAAHGAGIISGVSGGTSGTAMIACCAHHVVDIIPFIGLSGVALFLSQYQKAFLVLGVSINLFGIVFLLHARVNQKGMTQPSL